MSNRTKGVLFDTFVSNPSINEKIPYERMKTPTLIIHAIDDPSPPIAGARAISGRIPGSELVPFETGGHLIVDHEEEIKKIIRDFISR